MPILKDVDLISHVKNSPLQRVYLICGDEDYTLSRCVHLILQKAVPKELQSFNLNRFEEDKTPMQDIIDAAKTLPMLSERRAVVLLDPPSSFLSGSSFSLLKDYCEQPLDTTVFLVIFRGERISPQKGSKGASKGLKELCKIIEKTGIVVDCSTKTQRELSQFLISSAKRAGANLEFKEANYLIDRCGRSLTPLMQELKKLASYAAGGTITREMIDELTIPTLESTAFDLAKAILRKNEAEALSHLQKLFQQKLDEIRIISAVHTTFIDLYRAKCIQLEHADFQTVLKAYPSYKGKDFRLKKALQDSPRYSMAQIKACLQILYETDKQLKYSRADKRFLIERAVSQMLIAQKEVNPS